MGTVLVYYVCYILPIYPPSHQRSLFSPMYSQIPKHLCYKHSRSCVAGTSRNFRTSKESLLAIPQIAQEPAGALCRCCYATTGILTRRPGSQITFLPRPVCVWERGPASPAGKCGQHPAPVLRDQLSCSGSLGSRRE